MEEKQENISVSSEPEQVSENSLNTEKLSGSKVVEINDEGQSAPEKEADPESLILGKFKSQEDLINAYKQLEKLQGSQSAELGNLRQNSVWMKNIQSAWDKQAEIMNCASQIQSAAEKYNTPEYFQDPSFKAMYKEAYLALGKNLDTDRFINLLEGYVSSRLMKYQQKQAAKKETQTAINGMKFEENKNVEFKPSGKRIDEMSIDEINDILDKFI